MASPVPPYGPCAGKDVAPDSPPMRIPHMVRFHRAHRIQGCGANVSRPSASSTSDT